MRNFCEYMKESIYRKFNIDVDVFVSQKKACAFCLQCQETVQKREIIFDDYKMIYHRLIMSLRRRFDYVFFRRKKNERISSRENLQ